MVRYQYTGSGVVTLTIDDKPYTYGCHPRLKTEVDMPRKLNEKEMADGGLESVDMKKKKGDE